MNKRLPRLPNDFFDTITNRRECVHHRAARDPRHGLPKLYRDLQVRVHVHFSGCGQPFGDYCAVYGYYPPLNGLDLHRGCATTSTDNANRSTTSNRPRVSTGAIPYNAVVFGKCRNDIDDSVLIAPVDLVENQQGVVTAQSIVRLERLDNCPVLVGDPLEISIHSLLISRSVVGNAERESTLRCFGTQGGYENIESGAGIVREISNNDAPVVGDLPVEVAANNKLTGFRLVLYDEGIGVRFDEPFDSSFEICQVLVCPAKLQEWPVLDKVMELVPGVLKDENNE